MLDSQDGLTLSLVLRSYFWLLAVHVMLSSRGFGSVHKFVTGFQPLVRKMEATPHLTALIASFDMAKRFYVKELKCLHLAAAATLLLRSHGFPARMVFGVSPHPFFGHTWVEVDGKVVTGTSVRDNYIVLDTI
jgi:Transglutaminase-like superfamily